MALDTAKATVTLRTLTHKFNEQVQAATPMYPSLCTVVPSNGYDEAYGMLGDMPGMREWLGDRQFKELRAANFSLVNKHWESSILIKKTDMADDRMGLYGPVVQDLATEAAYHPDELMYSILVAGGSGLGFDGTAFYGGSHAWGDSGTQDNDIDATAASGTTPTAAEFRTAFHAARIEMMKFKNDQGKFLNRRTSPSMSNLMCLVPLELEEAARVGLTAELLGNNSNVVLDAPRIVPCQFLTDAAKFYLFNMEGALKPFVFQAREPLKSQTKGLTDIETKDVKFMTEARYNVGYLAWWKSVRVTFT